MNKKNYIKKVFTIFITFVFCLSFFSTNTVFSYNSFYSENDIMFYDENTNNEQNPSDICVSDGDVASKVWNFFIGKGLTKEQTAGIMGNIYVESHFSPTIWEKKDRDLFENTPNTPGQGYGWGLFQWSFSRRYNKSESGVESGILAKLKQEKPNLVKYVSLEYASEYAILINTNRKNYSEKTEYTSKIPESDLNELLLFELDYMWEEFQIQGYNEIKSTTTIVDATVSFHDEFERSADTDEKVRNDRGGFANIFYDLLKDNNTGNFSSNACVDSSENRLISYIKKYTWPTYLGKYKNKDGSIAQGTVAITPTTEYQQAVDAAKADGIYTGATCHKGGIDCGGYINLLVYNSGFDKNYNYNGEGTYYNDTDWKTGFTGVQIEWLRNNWQQLTITDSSQLKLGDIAIYNDGTGGHVFMFIGSEVIEGIDKKYTSISASLCLRAPMVTNFEVATAIGSGNEHNYTWFRRK